MWIPLLLGLMNITTEMAFVPYNDQIPTYPLIRPYVENKYNGHIIGTKGVSRSGRDYLSFRGIPYAEPPVGPLRFKNPIPITQPQSKILNATQDAPFCIQKNYFFDNHPPVIGQEDCLYLNVYVPVTYKNELLPVMVFIHYGGFFAGSGRSDILGPEYFMDEDIILVTLNYRLGAFGFLTSLDDNAPGNLGLKDQVVALKWVQENICYFGGDKNAVTVFGQSAGGGSAMLHLLSPASKGLYKQLISESGSALSLWARPTNLVQMSILQNQSDFVGCGDYKNNNADLIACLQAVDADVLADSADKFKYFQIEPLVPFGVVVETKTEANPEPFLEQDPLEILKAGEFERVPYIMGVMKDEGILRAASLLRQPDTRETLNGAFDLLLPQMMFLPFSTNDVASLWSKIVDFYFDGKHFIDINNKTIVQSFIDLYSDRAFVYGTYQSINALTKNAADYPLYVYRLDYRGQLSYGDLFAATSENIDFEWGPCHCDDLLYLFTSNRFFPQLKKASDILLSIRLVKMWTTFARTGIPDSKSRWSPVSYPNNEPENLEFLDIRGSANLNVVDFSMKKGFFPERMRFWQDMIIQENSINSKYS